MPMLRKLCSTVLLATLTMGGAARAAAGDLGPAASNWEVVLWTDPLTVSVDTASIQAHAARVTARVLWDYADLQRSEHGGGAYRSMVGTLVFDCASRSLGGAGSIAYSGEGGDGEPLAQFAIDPATAPLAATSGGTIGHDLLTLVCAHAGALFSYQQQRSADGAQAQHQPVKDALVDASEERASGRGTD